MLKDYSACSNRAFIKWTNELGVRNNRSLCTPLMTFRPTDNQVSTPTPADVNELFYWTSILLTVCFYRMNNFYPSIRYQLEEWTQNHKFSKIFNTVTDFCVSFLWCLLRNQNVCYHKKNSCKWDTGAHHHGQVRLCCAPICTSLLCYKENPGEPQGAIHMPSARQIPCTYLHFFLLEKPSAIQRRQCGTEIFPISVQNFAAALTEKVKNARLSSIRPR